MTDKEISDVLKNIVIICDSREQKNNHIIEYLQSNNLMFITKKLESGDYSFELPNYPELQLDHSILIERKNSWDEISQNFTKGRDRFTREFERIGNSTIHIIIEGATWLQMLRGSYRSKLPPKSFMASLFTWNARYNTNIWLARTNESPTIIYNIIYYGLREKLKNL